MAQARLAERDQGRVDGLVSAAFGAEGDAGRRRHQQETGVLVTGVIEAIEAAGDERVVERADRKQSLAEQIAGKPGGGEHQEQVGFGDAKLDVLALIARRPFLCGGNFCLREDVGHVPPLEQAALVHPGAEVGRDGDVGRSGDGAVRQRMPGLGEVEQDAAEGGLGRLLVAGWRGDGGDFNRAEGALPLVAHDLAAVDQGLDAGAGIGADAGERLPFLALGDAHAVAQGGHLRRVHQAGVIVLVAGERQAEALDRPGDEQSGNVVLRRVERLRQRFHAMAAKVAHQRRQLVVVMGREEGGGLLAEVLVDPRPPRCAALVEQGRMIGVGQRIEPVGDRRIGLQRRRQFLAVTQFDRPPAARTKNLVEALEHAVGAGRVEALAVVVDDPPAIADVVLIGLDQAFVDIALVQFGIAD